MYSPPTSETALEKSGCNRVGYFKTTNRVGKESCLVIQQNGNGWSFIPYNRAFHRNCDGKPIERWAWRNGLKFAALIWMDAFPLQNKPKIIFICT